jgi:TATA-binding protein-associated factor
METRVAASEQIAAIFVAQGSDFLPVLLGRVVPLLVVSSWDTRVAAAGLVGLVARESLLPSELVLTDLGGFPSVDEVLATCAVLGSGKNIHGGEPDRKRVKESNSGFRVSGAAKLKERELAKSSDSLALASFIVPEEVAPWRRLITFLVKQCENERWEARHGALLAMKGLIEAVPWDCTNSDVLIGSFLESAFRVLVLDRFNDFMSDRVMAPVREIAAQVVGLLLERAAGASFERVLGLVMELIQQEDWQLRHAGLLALRFATNRRNAIVAQLAPLLIDPMLGALDAEDDDVIAVAAEVILPAAGLVCEHSIESVGAILDRIWVLIESLNEISASIGCLLRLISAFYAVERVAQMRPLDKENRVALLFPLFRHGVVSVRLAIVEMFADLLSFGRPRNWGVSLLGNLFQACFYSFAIETDEQVLNAVRYRLWVQILGHVEPEQVCAAAAPLIVNWYKLLSSDVKDCNNLQAMRVFGTRAIAKLLLLWPKETFPHQVLALVKLLYSTSAKERLVGSLTMASLFGPMNCKVCIDSVVVAAFCQKVQDSLMCDWGSVLLMEDMDPQFELIGREFGRLVVEANLHAMAAVNNPLHIKDVCSNLIATNVVGVLERCHRISGLVARWVSSCSARHCQVEGAAAVAWVCLLLASGNVVTENAVTERAFFLLQKAIASEADPHYQKEWANGMVIMLLSSDASMRERCAPHVLREFASILVRDRSYTPLAGTLAHEEEEEERNDNYAVAVASSTDDDKVVDLAEVARLSVSAFFNALGERLGHGILLRESVLSCLWIDIAEALKEMAPLQQKIDALRIVQVLVSAIPLACIGKEGCFVACVSVLELLCSSMALTAGCWEVQSVLGEGVAAVARLFPTQVLRYLCLHVLPKSQDGSLNQTGNVALIASIHRVLQELHMLACPFLAFMVVPVLGAMSHRDAVVRRVAASAFAEIVSLMPLEAGTPDPVGFGEELSERRASERVFIQQLLGGEPPRIDLGKLGLMGGLQLRPYQQAGIAWLCFLARYQLHGILADDMGLGKTVQALCAVAQSLPNARNRPSLIVCPSSLVHHWMHEATTLFNVFVPIAYEGTLKERKELSAKELRKHNLIVASYETLRKDFAKFEDIEFLYCVLDEGHIIRNPASLATLACKSVRAAHRLILSGTPLQNDVVELWSLFDFLTPGYLGSQAEFRKAYGKFITASKDAKAKRIVRERGTLALEALHRQVLPFIMRRTKESVLKDLPPKVIQDFCCDMSPLQSMLYDDLANTDQVEGKKQQHTFQALQQLRKLCNHPNMIIASCSASEKQKANAFLSANLLPLDDACHSGKLLALEELLHSCGLGLAEEDQVEATMHRVLIFCQITASIDLIENLLLKKRMSKVTYVRLDGSVPQQDRFAMVKRFNSDPTIDLMLLTVKVGGLGLNLTGADTVIFFEHDWNPQVFFVLCVCVFFFYFLLLLFFYLFIYLFFKYVVSKG